MRKKIAFLSIALIALTDIALAQAPPTPATPPAKTATPVPSLDSASCAPHDTAAPNGTTTGERKEPLGDKLAKSDGDTGLAELRRQGSSPGDIRRRVGLPRAQPTPST